MNCLGTKNEGTLHKWLGRRDSRNLDEGPWTFAIHMQADKQGGQAQANKQGGQAPPPCWRTCSTWGGEQERIAQKCKQSCKARSHAMQLRDRIFKHVHAIPNRPSQNRHPCFHKPSSKNLPKDAMQLSTNSAFKKLGIEKRVQKDVPCPTLTP